MEQTHKDRNVLSRLIRLGKIRPKLSELASGNALMLKNSHETQQMELRVDIVSDDDKGSVVGSPIMCLDIDPWSGTIVGFSLLLNETIDPC